MNAQASPFAVRPAVSGDASGFTVSFNDGAAFNRCTVMTDPEGRLHAAFSTSGAAMIDADMIGSASPRDDVPWAFSMVGCGGTEPLLDRLGVPLAGRDALRGMLWQDIADASAEAAARLDPRALEILASCPARRPGTLAFYSGDGERAEKRRQAGRSYPLLADLMAASLHAKMAIDRQQPLAELAAKLAGDAAGVPVSRAALKRIAAAASLPDGCSLETVIRFMSLVPADWIPREGSEWKAFCHSAHALLECLSAPDGAVADLVRGCGGRWDEFCSRIAKRSGVEGGDPTSVARQAMTNAADMLDSFAHVCVLPLAAWGGEASTVAVTPEMLRRAREAAFAMLASGRNAGDLSDLQRRWHQERNAILDPVTDARRERMEELRGEIEQGSWPPLSEPVQAPNGLWLVPLVSPQELTEEGADGPDANGVRGLNHCVGGYANKSLTGQCHIVAVRAIDADGGYRRVTTIEFEALKDDGSPLRVRQNLGRGNSAAPAEAKDAASWYVSAARTGQVSLNEEQIAAFLNRETQPDDGVERACGYDWHDPAMLSLAISPWGPFVVSAYRTGDLQETIGLEPLRKVSELIPPDLLMAPAR